MAALGHDHDVGLLRLVDLHPADAHELILREGVPAAMRDGTWVGQTALLRRDGQQVPVRQIIIAHKATDGNAGYLSIIMHDLTGHFEAERRIREQSDFLNRARDAIIVTDLSGHVTFWNQGAERISGWESDAVADRTLDDVFGFVSHSEIEMAAKALEGSDEWRGEFRLHSKEGKLLVLEVSATLIRDNVGRPTSRLYIGTDVTAKRSLEEQFLRVQRLEEHRDARRGHRARPQQRPLAAPIFLAAPMLREHLSNPVDSQHGCHAREERRAWRRARAPDPLVRARRQRRTPALLPG